MSNLRAVMRFEITRTFRKKSFWYSTLLVPILIIVVITISIVSSNDASKTSAQQAQSFAQNARVGLFDQSGLINKAQLPAEHVILEPSKQSGVDAVKSGALDAFFYYPQNVTRQGIQVYTQDQGLDLTSPYSTAAVNLLQADVAQKIELATHDTQVVKLLQKTPSVSTTTYKQGKETNSIADALAPGVFMAAFLALVVLMSYLMLTSTTEEKENRAAEILLTAMKARTLIIGKILSIYVLGIAQILIIVIPLLIGYALFKSHIHLPGGVTLSQIPLNATAISLGLGFFVLGFVQFTGVLVGISALFPSAQEAGRYLGIAMIWAYMPFYAIGYIVSSPHSLIVNIFSYFPLTAPTMMLLRNTAGTVNVSEALPALAIVLVCATLAMLFAIRAFRYGAMEYGRRLSVRDVLR